MFERIKDFAWGVIEKMFSKETVQDALKINIAMPGRMIDAIRMWSELFVGGEGNTLRLPGAIASELARLTTIEMKSEVSGSKRADFLNEAYGEVIRDVRNNVEFACAKGGLVFKPYVADGKIGVDYIQADFFWPTSFDSSGNMTGAVFGERKFTGKDTVYTRLEYHEKVGEAYRIKNTAYRSHNAGGLGIPVSLKNVPEWAGIEPEVVLKNVPCMLFGYFKMPMANSVAPGSPVGVSAYARAVGLIQDANKQYERLLWEFESGDRAVYISDLALQKDKDGKIKYPKGKERLYRTLGAEDENFFKDWTPTIREQNILNGLDSILRRIEFSCGIAYGTLSNVQNADKTAEEIRASKQRSYATVSDIQRALQKALEELVEAMDVLVSLYKLAPAGKYEVSFEFDDSIIADRAKEYQEKKELVTLGVLKLWELRAWYLGETEEQAKKALEEDDGFLITEE